MKTDPATELPAPDPILRAPMYAHRIVAVIVFPFVAMAAPAASTSGVVGIVATLLATVAAALLFAVRAMREFDPVGRCIIDHWRLGPLRRQRRRPLDDFAGVAVGARIHGGGPPSYRILLVNPGVPPSHWGTHTGHLCLEVVRGHAAAEQRAGQLAQTLHMPLLERADKR